MDRPKRLEWHARRDATVSRAVSKWQRRWLGIDPAHPLATLAPLLIFQLPAASGVHTHIYRPTYKEASQAKTIPSQKDYVLKNYWRWWDESSWRYNDWFPSSVSVQSVGRCDTPLGCWINGVTNSEALGFFI